MKKIKSAIVGFLLILSLLVTGCTQPITSGTVIQKEYHKAWRQTMLIPITHIIGKMTYTTLIPYIIFHDENWCITIQNTNEENKTVRRDIYVSEEVYNKINVNETYTVNGTESFKEPTHKVKEEEVTDSDKASYEERK